MYALPTESGVRCRRTAKEEGLLNYMRLCRRMPLATIVLFHTNTIQAVHELLMCPACNSRAARPGPVDACIQRTGRTLHIRVPESFWRVHAQHGFELGPAREQYVDVYIEKQEDRVKEIRTALCAAAWSDVAPRGPCTARPPTAPRETQV